MSTCLRKIGMCLALLAGGAVSGAAAPPPGERVSEANFELARRWSVPEQIRRLGNPWVQPIWCPGRDAFFYRRGDRSTGRFYYVDLARAERRDLTANPSLRRLLAAAPESGLEISEARLAADGDGVLLTVNGQRCRYTVSTDRFSAAGPEEPDTDAPGVDSPDHSYRIVIREYNLFLESADHRGPATQITSDGKEYFEPIESSIQWSPDSRYVAFLRQDWRQVEDLWLIDHYAEPRPRLQTFKWPMPGENIELHSLWVYDLRSKTLLRVNADRWQEQTLAEPRWSPDSKQLYFTRMSRDWMSLDLCATEPGSGAESCRVVIEERDHRQIITRPPYHILETTGEILWWSMGGGWGHYSLHDRQGRLLHRVTSGDFHSGRVEHIDENRRILFFMGNAREPGRNPYYHHLYRVHLDGSQLRLLTPEDAEHDVSMSDSGRYVLDNLSRADLAPRAVVRNTEGAEVIDLGQADISRMTDAGWKPPEVFTAKAADGTTDIWGVMFKPFDFDPAKKYPVITYGYPGKETEFLPFRFCHNGWVTLVSTALSQYGFVVVVSGNRGGSPERSYEYYNFGEDRLRDYPVADKRAVIEELGRRHRYLDLDRVGVMGQSSGGFMAAAAILLEPDFFKVAVAKAGNHDNNLYFHHWNERYGRVRQRHEDGRIVFESKTESNNQIAANLQGRLLIVQGDMDLHVPPSLAYRLAYDLMMANKRFDMFVVPNCDHFWGDNMPYVHRYIELYFVENLMGDRRRWSADILQP